MLDTRLDGKLAEMLSRNLNLFLFSADHDNNDGEQEYEADVEQEIIQEADLVNHNTADAWEMCLQSRWGSCVQIKQMVCHSTFSKLQ